MIGWGEFGGWVMTGGWIMRFGMSPAIDTVVYKREMVCMITLVYWGFREAGGFVVPLGV
jgi:hypothetical protein